MRSGAERGAISRKAAFLALFAAAMATGMHGGRAQSQHIETLDPRALPLGDGKVSSGPRRGYLYSCATQFRGGGAQHAGDWIHGATWDSTGKIQVRGEVTWPNATFTITSGNGERRVVGNGLPLNNTTGIFPVQKSDPAFLIDRNPNRIEPQRVALSLPISPVPASTPACVPMGPIGVALNGVAIFNALDAGGRDAVAHEVQDRCNGHPERSGTYHYHGPSPCVPGATGRNSLVGYAFDGFGIYSMFDENGRELTNADLDECHGRVSRVEWNGREASMYHYVLTREYPYTVGCYRGTPARIEARGEGEPPRDNGPGGPRQPPGEAIAACAGLSPDAACRFISPHGDAIAGTCRSPAGRLACVPAGR